MTKMVALKVIKIFLY